MSNQETDERAALLYLVWQCAQFCKELDTEQYPPALAARLALYAKQADEDTIARGRAIVNRAWDAEWERMYRGIWERDMGRTIPDDEWATIWTKLNAPAT